jgi:hypothetical protein
LRDKSDKLSTTMTTINFTINDESEDEHIATITNVDLGDVTYLYQRLQLALNDHYDAEVSIEEVPPSVFDRTTFVDIEIGDTFNTTIRIERTFIY